MSAAHTEAEAIEAYRRRRQHSIAEADFEEGFCFGFDATAEDDCPDDVSDAFRLGFERGWRARA